MIDWSVYILTGAVVVAAWFIWPRLSPPIKINIESSAGHGVTEAKLNDLRVFNASYFDNSDDGLSSLTIYDRGEMKMISITIIEGANYCSVVGYRHDVKTFETITALEEVEPLLKLTSLVQNPREFSQRYNQVVNTWTKGEVTAETMRDRLKVIR